MFANAQLTPQLAELACHSLAVHPPRFRAQSKLPFQPRLRSSATAMIQCCCWRFAGLVTSYKAIRNQSLGHPDHQSSPTSLIQTSIVRRSRSLIGGFAPHREKAPCLSFSHLNNVLASSLYWTSYLFFFFLPFCRDRPHQNSFFFFSDKLNSFSGPFKARCPLVLVCNVRNDQRATYYDYPHIHHKIDNRQ